MIDVTSQPKGQLPVAELEVAVLATLDSKSDETRYLCDALTQQGLRPWVMDLALRPHENNWGDVGGNEAAAKADWSWQQLGSLSRAEAAEKMVAGASAILRDRFGTGTFSAVMGIGGANGSTMSCALMRSLPPLFPKVMVTPVAATAAVQWHVGASDIAMFPTIGDISLNRITRDVIDNAAGAVAGMAAAWARRLDTRPSDNQTQKPLIGISTFGNVQKSVDYITERLTNAGNEVIQFHASGPGGKALEHLAGRGDLAGVIELTTSELTDLLTGGVYSAGDDRLRAAGAAGLPQIVVPGSLDFTNWWVGEVPDRYHKREFYHYSVENLLMKTNAEEFTALGKLIGERLRASSGPYRVLVPLLGFSQTTTKQKQTVDGKTLGPWWSEGDERPFVEAIKSVLPADRIVELNFHINDQGFADACVDEYFALVDSHS